MGRGTLEAVGDRTLRRRQAGGLDRRQLQRGVPVLGPRSPRTDPSDPHRSRDRDHRQARRGAGALGASHGARRPLVTTYTFRAASGPPWGGTVIRRLALFAATAL